jgi:hypothetical protein
MIDQTTKAVAAATAQLGKLLELLAAVKPLDQADVEAVSDAAFYLRQARQALLDVGERV